MSQGCLFEVSRVFQGSLKDVQNYNYNDRFFDVQVIKASNICQFLYLEVKNSKS